MVDINHGRIPLAETLSSLAFGSDGSANQFVFLRLQGLFEPGYPSAWMKRQRV